MNALVLSLVISAAFPLPAIDGKPLAVSEGQKVFRLPLRFERVKQFYLEQLGQRDDVTLTSATKDGVRVLVLKTKATGEAWTKAVVREGESETIVEVTPVMRIAAEEISGSARPLVEFVIGRSPEVQKAVQGLGHADQMMR